MSPEERQRIEGIRGFLPLDNWWANEEIAWLLALVERQEAEIARLRTRRRHVFDEPEQAPAAKG